MALLQLLNSVDRTNANLLVLLDPMHGPQLIRLPLATVYSEGEFQKTGL